MGMPLSGKTTIGRALSSQLNKSFYDLDEYIEQKNKNSIFNIINKKGEEKFRIIESDCLRSITKKDHHILSLGGGTVNSNNIDMLLNYSTRIWLKSDIQTLMTRFNNDDKNQRPFIDSTNLFESFSDIYSHRKENYKKCSNYAIKINKKPINVIVKELLDLINERN